MLKNEGKLKILKKLCKIMTYLCVLQYMGCYDIECDASHEFFK